MVAAAYPRLVVTAPDPAYSADSRALNFDPFPPALPFKPFKPLDFEPFDFDPLLDLEPFDLDPFELLLRDSELSPKMRLRLSFN